MKYKYRSAPRSFIIIRPEVRTTAVYRRRISVVSVALLRITAAPFFIVVRNAPHRRARSDNSATMDACVIEIADNPEILDYKRNTGTLDATLVHNDNGPYGFTNEKLLREAEKNPNSWYYKKLHSSATVLSSNYLVRNLNVSSSTIHFVKK